MNEDTGLRSSVTGIDIRCCAKKCPASKENTTEKFFFNFPPYDPSDEDSVIRCRTWIKKAGNAELLKHRMEDLSEKFFLCCNHFADWSATNNIHRFITDDAIPSYFDCSPLGNHLMKRYEALNAAGETLSEVTKDPSEQDKNQKQNQKSQPLDSSPVFPVTNPQLEIVKIEPDDGDHSTANTSDNFGAHESATTETDCKLQTSVELTELTTKLSTECDNLIDVPMRPVAKPLTNTHAPNFDASECSSLKSQNVASKDLFQPDTVRGNVRSIISLNAKQISNRRRPSRKAKLDAVNKICNQPNIDKEVDNDIENGIEEREPPRKLGKPTDKKPSSVFKQKLKSIPSRGTHIMTADACIESDESETDLISTRPRKSFVKGSFTPCGAKFPERVAARSLIVSHNIVSKLGKPCENVNRSSPLKYIPVSINFCAGKTASASSNKAPVLQNSETFALTNFTSETMTILNAKTGMFEVHPSPERVENNILPLCRSAGTQTNVQSSGEGQEILKILDTDQKLNVFSGLPSYAVLDTITDATLKLVMNNKATISDVEPTMRQWIILTCTKFRLRLPLEALSVMFEVPEEECKKIVEKTCLFLRKTLALADCQKFVWFLPNEVLTGIADCSDALLLDN